MRLTWNHPRYQVGDWVIYLRGRHAAATEGQVQDVVTTYTNGRAQHSYKVKPTGLKNTNLVPEGMIKRAGKADTYGAVRYNPTRTLSDSRTGAQHARP